MLKGKLQEYLEFKRLHKIGSCFNPRRRPDRIQGTIFTIQYTLVNILHVHLYTVLLTWSMTSNPFSDRMNTHVSLKKYTMSFNLFTSLILIHMHLLFSKCHPEDII